MILRESMTLTDLALKNTNPQTHTRTHALTDLTLLSNQGNTRDFLARI